MRSKTPGRTLVDVDLAVVRRVEDLERALEALRLEQELEVRLAARPQEGHHGFVRLDGLDAAGGSRGKRRVASMAYEPPQTLRTQRADISAFVSVPLQSTSMRSKHLRAAFKNSLLNSSISLAARAASSSRLAARSASLFLRASSIAASLRGTPTGEPRETPSTPPARHRRGARVDGAPNYRTPKRTTRPCRCARPGRCRARRAPPRGAPGPAGTGGFYCRS